MKNRITSKQLAANRRNALKSTGPKSANGKAVSRMNALKHGILSKQVLVKGHCIKESRHEFKKLHQRFWDELQPEGPVEEMLVDQIVTCHWRQRRALTAESGEIALSVDEGQWHRKTTNLRFETYSWQMERDPSLGMRDSAFGNRFMESQLQRVIASVEREGELTEAAIKEVIVFGKPYYLTRELEKLRATSHQNPDGLSPEASREKRKEELLTQLKRKLRSVTWAKEDCEQREQIVEESRQAAASLPSADVLDKIMRYETKLQRQLFRAMTQLERLRRMRRGESIPAPMTVDVSERC